MLCWLAGATSAAVIALFVVRALALVAYPWDWSPDEGLSLDWGRRMWTSPASLYGHALSPFPAVYGPFLPLLLAPVAVLGDRALGAARVVALCWTAASTTAVYLLVRRCSGSLAGLCAAALSLSALDFTFLFMLVRPDGLMLALWLLAALALVPRRLESGADRLSWPRIGAGTVLLLAAVLTKGTAVLHGAPLVLGWLVVDRRSAWRLMLTLFGTGGAVLLALTWATSGGFLWVANIWSLHGTQPGLRALIVAHSVDRLWPLTLPALAALACCARRWRELLGDGSLLLLAGALVVLPLLSKYGASWNYFLPLAPALCVLGARWWALAFPDAAATMRRLGPPAAAAVAVALAATRVFPLPTAADERTASAFYSFVAAHSRRSGGPILALRPELAYFVAGQPVEMEGSGFVRLAERHAPGTERVLERLSRAEYSLVVQMHELPASGGYREALDRGYRHAGGCNLSFYFGTVPVHLFTRRDLPLVMSPPEGTRCGGPASLAAPDAGTSGAGS